MTVVQRSDVTFVQRSDVTVVQRSDQATVIVATVIVATVIVATVIVATGTAVIHTGMTGTVTVEATVIAVVTATPEADLQRLRRYSSSLSHLRPCVAEMTGIVLVMLGPGEAFQVFAANVALIMLRYDEPPRFAPPPSFDDRGRGGYGDRCDCFFEKCYISPSYSSALTHLIAEVVIDEGE